METENKQYIQNFIPMKTRLDSATSAELSLFHAGEGFESFDAYLIDQEAADDVENGKGVTHLIWNSACEPRELVAYFTLCTNVIPYDDGIDENPDISDLPCISVAEIKAFAVSEKYQDVFYEHNDLDLPISAWCIKSVIDFVDNISKQFIGIQALYLHSVPTAEEFYRWNNFSTLPPSAMPLFSVDHEYTAMWLPIREVHIPSE